MPTRAIHVTLMAIIGAAAGCSGPRVGQFSRDVRRDLVAVQKEDPPPASPYDARPSTPAQAAKPLTVDQLPGPLPPPIESAVTDADQSPSLLTHPALKTSRSVTAAGAFEPGRIQLTTNVEPVKPKDPLVRALSCFRDKNHDEALKQLQNYDSATREALVLILHLAARLGDRRLPRMRPRELSLAMEELELAQQVFRDCAPLVMQTMCFCRTVERFGVYEPLPKDHAFQAGAPGRPGDLVQVYVELKNFGVRKNGPFFETALASTLELRDRATDQVRWSQDRPAHVERSRSPRHDCFLNCVFSIPKDLPPGRYALWIHVKDVTGSETTEPPPSRVASGKLDLSVRRDGDE